MKFAEIKDKARELNLKVGEYALCGSVPLAAHGIRDANDIDMVVLPEVYEGLKKKGWKVKTFPGGERVGLTKDVFEAFKDWNYGSYNPPVAELINGADIIDGIPIVKLGEVLKWKRVFNREKDRRDVALIEEFMKRSGRKWKG